MSRRKNASAAESAAKAKAAALAAAKDKKAAAKAAPAKAKGLSLVAAAAQVLAESGEALNCRRMVALAKERGLWEQGRGKTPEQTLYSAVVREIADRGEGSRFRKSEVRGLFLANAAPQG